MLLYRNLVINSFSRNMPDLQTFTAELKALQTLNCVSTSDGKLASLALLQNVIDLQGVSSSSPLLEASLHLAKSLTSKRDASSPWEKLLTVHTQLELAAAHIENEPLSAGRLLRSLPSCVEASTVELNARRELCTAVVNAKLQRACGGTCLANARLMSTLKRTTEAITGMTLQHDLPARLLLECYLSGTVTLCRWLAESGTMSWGDLISQLLKPVSYRSTNLATSVVIRVVDGSIKWP